VLNRAGATTGRQEGACGAYEISSPVRFRIWRLARPSVAAATLAVSGVVPGSPRHFRGSNANRGTAARVVPVASRGGGATDTSRRPLRPLGGAAGLRLLGRGRGWVRRVVARAPGPAPAPAQGRRFRPSLPQATTGRPGSRLRPATADAFGLLLHKPAEGRTREDSLTPGRGAGPRAGRLVGARRPELARGASSAPGARRSEPGGSLVGVRRPAPAVRLLEAVPTGLDQARSPVGPTLRLTRRPAGPDAPPHPAPTSTTAARSALARAASITSSPTIASESVTGGGAPPRIAATIPS
jgi:hypothetical protein